MEKRKKGKRCAYANCPNNKGEDANLIFIPFPKPCKGYNDELVKKLLHQNIPKHHNVAKCDKCLKCRTWIHMCRRADGLHDLCDINKNTYVCSKHFVSDAGPTALHPHPLPATLTEAQVEKTKLVRKPPKSRSCPKTSATKRKRSENDIAVASPKQLCILMPNLRDDAVGNERATPDMLEENFHNLPATAVESQGTQTYITATTSRGMQTHTTATMSQETETDCMRDLSSFAESCMTSGWACEIKDKGCNFLLLDTIRSESEDFLKSVLNIHVHLNHNFEYTVYILGRKQQITEEIGGIAAGVSSTHDLQILLKKLKVLKLCRIWEQKHMQAFQRIRSATQGVVCSQTGVVRSLYCKLITRGIRCHSCVKYVSTIRRYSEPNSRQYGLSKFCNNRFLGRKELELKAAECRKKLQSATYSNKRLRTKIKEAIQCGHVLHDTDNADLSCIIEECVDDVDEHCQFRNIFLEEQRKVANRKSSNGYRWHPLMIKWCLYIKHKSSATYTALRESGCIQLPSDRTLFKYGAIFQKTTGFPTSLPEHTIKKLEKLQGHQQYFALMFDEIKISEELVYKKNTGELVGYTSLSDTMNSISQSQLSRLRKKPPLASHILQFMVQGLTTSMRFSFAHFATANLTADQLYGLVLEGIEILKTKFGVKILVVICDGAASNRSFFRIAASTKIHGNVKYYMENYFAQEPRLIYFVPDPCHLIKNVRNCLANSGSHLNSRYLWKNGQHLLWETLVKAYKSDLGNEIRILPRVTDSHIYLEPYSKMKVRYAAQILSGSMSAVVQRMFGDEASEMVKFLNIFNKFFDILNVRHLQEGQHQPMDKRLQWLEDGFAMYLDDWEKDVMMRPGSFVKSERKKMMLPDQTLEGLRIIARSAPAIVRFLLEQGASFFLTGKLNQDPVEKEFSRQRAAGGSNTNPNVLQYNLNSRKSEILRNLVVAGKGGNTQ